MNAGEVELSSATTRIRKRPSSTGCTCGASAAGGWRLRVNHQMTAAIPINASPTVTTMAAQNPIHIPTKTAHPMALTTMATRAPPNSIRDS
jgi:hypothetical protein